MPASRKPPKYKKKLISLHLDGKAANYGMAAFVGQVLSAAAQRQAFTYNTSSGEPTFHVNAAGDLCIYVLESSV